MWRPRQAVLTKSSIWKACGLSMPNSHSFSAGTCSSRQFLSVCVTFSRRKSSTLLEQMKPTITCSMIERPSVIMFIVLNHCGMQQYPNSHSRFAISSTNEKPVRIPLNWGAGAAPTKYFFTLSVYSEATSHPLLLSLERWNSGTVPRVTSCIEEFVVVMPISLAAKKVFVSILSTGLKNSEMLPSLPQSEDFFQKSASFSKASLQCSSLAHFVSQATLMATKGLPSILEMRKDFPSGDWQISSQSASRGVSLGATLSLVMGQSPGVSTQQPLHKSSPGAHSKLFFSLAISLAQNWTGSASQPQICWWLMWSAQMVGRVLRARGCRPGGHCWRAGRRARRWRGAAARSGESRYMLLGMALRCEEKMVCAIQITRMMLMKMQPSGARRITCRMYSPKRSSCSWQSSRARCTSSRLSRPIRLFILLSRPANIRTAIPPRPSRPAASKPGLLLWEKQPLIANSVVPELQSMDSAKSFFPTRADLPSRDARKQGRLYRLCRGASSDGPAYSTLDPASSSNIFREGGEGKEGEESREVGRPIGGEEFFRRMEQLAQERRLEGRKLRRTSREYHPRNVQTSIGAANPLIKRTATESDAAVLDLRILLLKHPPKETAAEELFKSHQGYQSSSSERCAVGCAGKRGLVRSVQTIQAKFAPKQVIERIDRQVQAHQDKSALLGEMDRGRPLVELCGDSYFEMTLRNRFEDEVKLPGYVYRIKDRLTENRVISRLRSFKPDLLQRRQLVLKGHCNAHSTIQ